MAQTMTNSDSLRLLGQLQIVKSVAFSKSVSKSVYQLVSQSVSYKKVMRMSWESHDNVMIKSWDQFPAINS